MACLFIALRFLEKRNWNDLILMSLIVSAAVLMRASTIALFVLVGTLVFYEGYRRKWKFKANELLKVAFPALLVIPYFINVGLSGHSALGGSGKSVAYGLGQAFSRVWDSVLSGLGPMTMLNSTTLPWAVFGAFAVGYALFFAREKRERLLFLLFFPAYFVFFSIGGGLVGVGRYQAEYLCPFIALGMFYVGTKAGPKLRPWVAGALLFLIGVTLEVHAFLANDINYRNWPQARITTSGNYPYREALSYLRRQEVGGHFALIGGTEIYADVLMWLSGHSFAETEVFKRKYFEFDQMIESSDSLSLSDIRYYCLENKIPYLVIQRGTRRERQHQTEKKKEAIRIIENSARIYRSGVVFDRSFGPEGGGILDIYRVL